MPKFLVQIEQSIVVSRSVTAKDIDEAFEKAKKVVTILA